MSRLDEMLDALNSSNTIPGTSAVPGVNALQALFGAEKLGRMAKGRLSGMIGQPDDPGTFAGGMARGIGQGALSMVPMTPSEMAMAYLGGKAVGAGAGALAKAFPKTLGMDVGSKLQLMFNPKARKLIADITAQGINPKRPWEGLSEQQLADEMTKSFTGGTRNLNAETMDDLVARFEKAVNRESLNRPTLIDDMLTGTKKAVRGRLGNARGEITLGPDDPSLNFDKLPVVKPGSKEGPAHALLAYKDNFGPDESERMIVDIFGDPNDPLVKKLGHGTSITLEQAKAAGIPIVGAEPRAAQFFRKAS